jgi:predicted RecB family nuclease
MNALPNTDKPAPLLVQGKLITSRLFEAYLACPTKCYLQSKGEVATGSEFVMWQGTRNKSYRFVGIQRLQADYPQKIAVGVQDLAHWKRASWHLALEQIVRSQNLEAHTDALQRFPSEGTTQSRQLIPIRFAVATKLSRSDTLVAAFDAVVLSKVAGVKVGLVKIIHGDNYSTFTLKANTLSRVVNKTIGQIVALLDAPSPPDLTLNRHCSECEFQDRCRKKAVEKDDLSLLVNLPIKERVRLNGKGIFTVNQLSYTFRPRRRIKRLASKSEKYHHSLKALAIRQQKIHIVGASQMKIEGTPVYLDAEGVPDRDFYYLIGVRLETEAGATLHSLWADTVADEKRMWSSFLDILATIDQPVLIHYGSYETTFLKRMCDRYGKPSADSAAAKAIASSVNLLSIIFARVYFPTYSNGLKDIARFLGYAWTHPSSSGLQSIAWHHEWESSRDPALREILITYNAEDCEALNLVASALGRLSQADSDANKIAGTNSEIVRVESLGKSLNSKWRIFKSPLPDLEKINVAAHWDYQRGRVFV